MEEFCWQRICGIPENRQLQSGYRTMYGYQRNHGVGKSLNRPSVNRYVAERGELAKPDRRRRSSAYTTVTFSATPTFTVTASTTVQDFQITLTGNVTSSTLNLTSATTGQDIGIKICQDGTGGRTFAWPSNVIGFGAITTTLSQCSKQIFRYDGTNAVAFGPMVNDGATPGIQTSSGFLTLPTAPDTIAGIAATQTLTNKSIDGSEINSGTLPNARIAGLPNANLANSSVTYNGQAVALGATGNVNNGATAHSVALNEGAGAAIAGATIGTAGRILIDQGAAADPAFEVASGSCTVAANGAFTCSGGAGGGGLSGWSNASPASFTVTATQYAPFAGGGNTSGTGAESTVQNKASAAATITGVQCSLNAAFGAGASAVITLRDGAASQTPICTIAAGGTVGVSFRCWFRYRFRRSGGLANRYIRHGYQCVASGHHHLLGRNERGRYHRMREWPCGVECKLRDVPHRPDGDRNGFDVRNRLRKYHQLDIDNGVHGDVDHGWHLDRLHR